jgi:hypothetical protein
MSEPITTSGSSPSPRKKKIDRSELPLSNFLPKTNLPASWGYVLALVGLIPGLGLPCGLLAWILGTIGYRRFRRDPNVMGHGISVVAKYLGVIEFVCNSIGMVFVAIGLDWL